MKLVAFLTLLCLLVVNAEEVQDHRSPKQCYHKNYSDLYKIGIYCVKFFNKHLDFNTARVTCQKSFKYGELVSVHSKAANNLLTSLISSSHIGYAWLGGFLQGSNWIWTDGSVFDYHRFVSGPETNNPQCSALKESGSWVPMNCSKALPFYCAFPEYYRNKK
ncbi:snaclec VP12 subunit B-like [Paramormyrops kingsleyae]|uniref:snaclec VP12 subunit B-like n=1 Tax=Paramormyrops kingsleyae TaxID=1676925 RepID=UPI000CD5FD30|nr:snaclec VP12 subunit B-like [Paramormyrops kingsleyae]